MDFHFLHKAKTKDTFRWVTGWLIQKDGGWQIYSGGKFYLVEPHTICVFTGANDINDTMVFEGDFVYNFLLKRTGVILWNNKFKRFVFSASDKEYNMRHIKHGNTVVVGSAYDITKIAANIPDGMDRNMTLILQECLKEENFEKYGSIELSNEYKMGGISL